jgi:branched-chain amino acid transport system substrate-binding protein
MSKNVRHFLAGVAAAAMMFTASLAHAADPAAGEPYRMPFPYIFSGPLVDIGERVWAEAVLPAVEKINKEGGIKGRPLELYKIDVRFPETAAWITEFRRLCADPSVPVIFGVGATKSVLAIYDDLKKCGIPVFAPTSGGEWPHKDFADWIFRYQPTPSLVAPIMLKKAKEAFNIKTAAITYTSDDEYSVNNTKITRDALQKLGIKIVTEQTFRSKETNLASQVSALNAAKPDAIVMHHQPGDLGTMVLQLRERGIKAQLIGDTTIASEDAWRLSKGGTKGAVAYALYAADDDRPIAQEWLQRWRQKTKRTEYPDTFVTAYYDTMLLLAHVLNGSDLSRTSVRDAFLRLKNYETISGGVTYPAAGDVERADPILVQVGDGGAAHLWK